MTWALSKEAQAASRWLLDFFDRHVTCERYLDEEVLPGCEAVYIEAWSNQEYRRFMGSVQVTEPMFQIKTETDVTVLADSSEDENLDIALNKLKRQAHQFDHELGLIEENCGIDLCPYLINKRCRLASSQR